ncbi:hypothetical protein ACOME3_009288 [Neoechinorhynchus agilis]
MGPMLLLFILKCSITLAHVQADNASWECQIGYRAEVSITSDNFANLSDIEWRRNNDVIKLNDPYYHVSIVPENNTSSLTIQRVVSTDFDVDRRDPFENWTFSATTNDGKRVVHDFGPIRQLPSVEGFIPDNSDKVTRSSISKTDGSPLTLQCKISVGLNSTVLPTTISWFVQKEGAHDYVPFNGNLTTTTYQNDTLNIDQLKNSDRGSYNCFMQYITQDHSLNSSMSTYLRVKSKYGALWPFIGIIAEVVLLVALILVCERRQKKKHEDISPDEERLSGKDDKESSDQL